MAMCMPQTVPRARAATCASGRARSPRPGFRPQRKAGVDPFVTKAASGYRGPMARCFFTVAIVALSSWQPAQAQDKPQPVTVRKLTLVEYATVFYPSGNLNIEAYVYSPKGSGPFPAVVYNHGNRGPDKEKDEA